MTDSVRVKVSGLNLSRFINNLLNAGVLIDNLEIKNNYIKFSIKEYDLYLLNKVCKKEKKFYTIIEKNWLKQVLKKLPYLFGFIFAFVLIFVFMFSYSLFVFDVNVSSVGEFKKDDVIKLLSENNIKVGTLKKDVIGSEVERLIVKNIDNVSGCKVEFVGGKLNIVVYPATEKQEVQNNDIVSLYDAVITECEVSVGDANVKVGDIVKKGDVLIKNINGAGGKIKGKVYFSSSKIYNENQQITKKTGRVFKINNLKCFNKITFKNVKKQPFSSFIIEKCDFYIFDNYLVPIICESLTYYETVVENVVVPFENVEEKIIDDLKNEIIISYGNSVDDSKFSYSIVTEGKYTRVDCFLEVEVDLF